MIGAAQRTPGVVLSEISMRNAASPLASFLIEGESDHRFWKRFVVKAHYRLVMTGGKKTMLGVVAKLDDLEHGQVDADVDVIALLDLDFDRITGRLTRSPRLAYTDAHDLETELVASGVLDELVEQFVSSSKNQSKLEDLNCFGIIFNSCVVAQIECNFGLRCLRDY